MDVNRIPILCRVCLLTDPKLRKKCLSLFGKHNDIIISDSINLIANVKIQESDGLPDKICSDCLLELDTAINFKLKCENSNLLLTNKARLITSNETSLGTQLTTIKKEEPFEETYLDEDVFLSDNVECNFIGLENKVELEIEPLKNENLSDEDKLEVKKGKAIDLKLQCHDCGEIFKSKCKLRVHWKRVHLYESLICQTCKRAFKSIKAYQRHVQLKLKSCLSALHVNIEGIGKQRVFNCKTCSYTTRRIKDIATHYLTHSGEKPVECDLCDKKFSQLSSLEYHKETAHKIYKVETTCQYCGKYLKGRRRIHSHLKLHSPKYVQCDVCKKKLRSKEALKDHIQRHTGVKLYTCEKCAQTFYALSELCNHRRTKHEKGRDSYKCDICGYRATKSTTIKKHKAKHTDSNMACIECGMFAPDAEKLAIHQRRHFDEKKFVCPHCDKKFLRRKGLSVHVRQKHKCNFSVNKPIKLESKEVVNGNVFEVDISPMP